MAGQNGHSANGNGAAKKITAEVGGVHLVTQKLLRPDPLLAPDDKPPETPVWFDEKGKFAKGNPGGPGRPPGSVDLFKVARAQAKKSGHSLDKVVEIALRALTRSAAARDVNAAKVLLDRLCGPLEKTQINVGVGVTNNTQNVIEDGPPIPKPGDFRAYLGKLNELAASQGLIGDLTPEQIEAAAIEEARRKEQELEDMLS